MLAEIVSEQVALPPEYGGLTTNGAQIAVALELTSDRFRELNEGAQAHAPRGWKRS